MARSFAWRDQAACLDMDPEIFFPGSGATFPPEAQAVCDSCPVRLDCLGLALDTELEHRYGYYGGLGPPQRKALAKKRDLTLSVC